MELRRTETGSFCGEKDDASRYRNYTFSRCTVTNAVSESKSIDEND